MPTYSSISPIQIYSTVSGTPPPAITSLAFDPVADTLWTGLSNGTVVARHSAARPFKGITFSVGGGASVSKLSAGDAYVRASSAGSGGMGSWSKGGANQWSYQYSTPESRNPASITTFTPDANSSHHLALASTSSELIFVDSRNGTSVRRMSTPSVVTQLQFSHSLLLSGSFDGYVRAYDARTGLRSERGTSSFGRAHHGSIQGLQCSANYVFTIGIGLRHTHPVPDSFVKVYDLRTMSALPPVPFSDGAAFLNAVPRKSSTICVTSNTGNVSILDVSNLSSTQSNEFHALNLASSAHVTATAISPTGAYIAFSDVNGTIHLLSAAAEATDAILPFCGSDPQPPYLPHTQGTLPEIQWTDSTPLNTIGLPHYSSPLLSSWSDAMGPRKGVGSYFPPPPRIPLQKLSLQYADGMGFCNNLPKEFRGKRNITVLGNRGRGGKPGARFRSGKGKETDEDKGFDSLAEEIPKEYRPVEIEYSKFGVDDFDFDYFNKTPYSGLETHILNSYTNSLVQILHHCSPISRLSRSHTTIDCPKEHCLLCELGFVSRMLQDAKGRNCQASNFCKTVGVLAQAANAIDLVDYGRTRSDAKLGDIMQSFNRFLIDTICAEANSFKNPSIRAHHQYQHGAPSPVTQLMGVHQTILKTCGSCKATSIQRNMSHVVDMSYSSLSPDDPRDFPALVRASLLRQVVHKANCQSCRYTTNHASSRSIESRDLPPVLVLNASCHNEDQVRLWTNVGKTRFLPKGRFGLRGQVAGVDDAEVVEYQIRALVVQSVGKNKQNHLAAVIKVPDAEKDTKLESPWFVFNDFVVSNVSEDDALGFPGSWKVPAIVYLERVDMDSQLDLSAFPERSNPAILCHDTSISQNRVAGMIKHRPLDYSELPAPGTRIAIDAEFVSMQQEESEYHSDGSKRIIRPARHGLARVSVLRADGDRAEVPFIDDHIHTTEPIVDYLTEYSGIQPGDLDPRVSPHTLTPLKVVYKKLRLLVDLGCIFIGHGLKQDFRIINIYVPPEQVLDTVNVYYLSSRQRRISLRFLSWYVLDQRIQDGVHDSIEDAKFALLLYKKYERLEEEGKWTEFLEDLYKAGRSHQWKPPPVPDEVYGPEHGLVGFMSSNSNLNLHAMSPNPMLRFNPRAGNMFPTSLPTTPMPYSHMGHSPFGNGGGL